VGRPHDKNLRLAIDEIFRYIERNENCQFTLTELIEVITNDFISDPKTISYKLTAHYGKYILMPKYRTLQINNNLKQKKKYFGYIMIRK